MKRIDDLKLEEWSRRDLIALKRTVGDELLRQDIARPISWRGVLLVLGGSAVLVFIARIILDLGGA